MSNEAKPIEETTVKLPALPPTTPTAQPLSLADTLPEPVRALRAGHYLHAHHDDTVPGSATTLDELRRLSAEVRNTRPLKDGK